MKVEVSDHFVNPITLNTAVSVSEEARLRGFLDVVLRDVDYIFTIDTVPIKYGSKNNIRVVIDDSSGSFNEAEVFVLLRTGMTLLEIINSRNGLVFDTTIDKTNYI